MAVPFPCATQQIGMPPPLVRSAAHRVSGSTCRSLTPQATTRQAVTPRTPPAAGADPSPRIMSLAAGAEPSPRVTGVASVSTSGLAGSLSVPTGNVARPVGQHFTVTPRAPQGVERQVVPSDTKAIGAGDLLRKQTVAPCRKVESIHQLSTGSLPSVREHGQAAVSSSLAASPSSLSVDHRSPRVNVRSLAAREECAPTKTASGSNPPHKQMTTGHFWQDLLPQMALVGSPSSIEEDIVLPVQQRTASQSSQETANIVTVNDLKQMPAGLESLQYEFKSMQKNFLALSNLLNGISERISIVDDRAQSQLECLQSQLHDLTYRTQAQLDSYETQQLKLQSSHDQLSEQHGALTEDLATLRESINFSGIVTEESLQNMRRWRRMSGLWKALHSGEFGIGLGIAAGCTACRSMSATSRLHYESIRRIQPTLLAQSPRAYYVCGGNTGIVESSAFERFVERFDGSNVAGTWESLPPIQTPRRWFGAVHCSGYVYIVGGHNGIEYLDSAERFDIERGYWEAVPDMPTPREGCAVASAGGIVYVFGGSHGESALKAAEAFDPESCKWESIADMPFGSDASAVATDHVGRSVFVVGGRNGRAFLDNAERLDVESQNWYSLPAMPTPRLGCAAAYVSGGLFVAGGHLDGQALSVLERFDFLATSWDVLDSMQVARLGCASVVAMGVIHVFGGHDGDEAVGAVECFNVAEGTWTRRKSLLTSRYGCAAAVASL